MPLTERISHKAASIDEFVSPVFHGSSGLLGSELFETVNAVSKGGICVDSEGARKISLCRPGRTRMAV